MTHVAALFEVTVSQPSIVTIGVFDGVHLGHEALIRSLVQEARATDRQAIVLTFFPHPDVVIQNIQGRYYLTSAEERAQRLVSLGVDWVVTMPFNDDLRNVRAEPFVDELLRHLNMQSLWVGRDFAMGYKREGNLDLLGQLGQAKGFELRPIDLVHQNGGETITSTWIRNALAEGDVSLASKLLGRPYQVQGEVVRGDQRGRTIGFPTANMAVWDQQVLPLYGVYAGRASLGNETFMAVTNVGIRPTFDGTRVTVEPHLLDFDRDIYGETLTLTFETRLRGEQKFAGIDALKAQLSLDVEQARHALTQTE